MTKIKELSAKTVELLERTKKHYKLYEKERKELYEYLVNKKDEERWEAYIKEFEESINEEI